MEEGTYKKVSILHVTNVVNFTGAKAHIIKKMKPFIDDNFTIESIKKVNYAEVISYDSGSLDKWFKTKKDMITTNKVGGKEKKRYIVNLMQVRV